MSLARLSLIKSAGFLNITGNDSDALLKELLAAATDFTENWCKRQLVSATVTDEMHKGSGRKEMFLEEWPVTTLTSVSFWSGTANAFASESTAYFSIIESMSLYYPALGQESNASYGAFPISDAYNVKVTYVAGYDNTDWDTDALADTDFAVPQDLEYGVAMIAALMFLEGRGSTQGRLGITGMEVGDMVTKFVKMEKGLTPVAEQMLMNYKRPAF